MGIYNICRDFGGIYENSGLFINSGSDSWTFLTQSANWVSVSYRSRMGFEKVIGDNDGDG